MDDAMVSYIVAAGVLAICMASCTLCVIKSKAERARALPPIDTEQITKDGGRFVQLTDGRIVEYFVYGSDAPDARVVVEIHGSMMNGWNMADPRVWGVNISKLKDLNIRAIAPSLPGAGLTSAIPGRKIADWPKTDLAPILQQEGVDRFMVAGTSEGAAHSLAAGHHFGKRVDAMGVYCTWLPNPIIEECNLPRQPDEPPQWLTTAWMQNSCCGACLFPLFGHMMTPEKMLSGMVEGLDVEINNPENNIDFGDAAWKQAMAEGAARTLKHSYQGQMWSMAHEVMWADWGFDPRNIEVPRVVVAYMQGDKTCPPEHGDWLASHFEANCPGTTVVRVTSKGSHMGVVSFLHSGELTEKLAHPMNA